MNLTGRDSSLLTLLAESKSLSSEQISNVLASLQGRALELGEMLTGKREINPEDQKAIEKWQSWIHG